MRNPYLIILLFVASIGYSQSHGISYQAVLLNPKGEELPGQNNNYLPLLDQKVCLRFEIRNATNQLEYQETISTKTDSFGMVNLIIGTGNQTGGTAVNFDALQWNTMPKKLVVAMDTKGNCNSFVEISNQEFAGVPFAFSAQNAENVIGIVPVTNGGTGASTAAIARKNLGLENLNNTSDTNKPVSLATQTALDLKENLSNKSNNIIVDANSTTKYPSVKIIKEYVDATVSAGVPDATSGTIGKIQLAGDLTGSATAPVIANNAITDAKVANGISASKVGLGNVDNTSDLNKPISTVTQTALDLKAPLASPTFTGTVAGITKAMVGLGNVDDTTDLNKPISTATQTALDLKAPLASPTFTGTVAGITKAMVGLGNVDDTTDLNKPISTATQTALDLKAPLASPTFTGTVEGITKAMVGLGNVDDTTDLNKPISAATQSALDLKQNTLTNPVTGTGTANALSKFTGTATLGNSNISDNGTVVSITTDAKINSVSVGRGSGNFDSNTVLGINSLFSNTSGINNSALGFNSLANNTTGSQNVAIGRDALYNNKKGASNIAIGKSALLNNTGTGNNTGSGNIALGLDSALENTIGFENIAIGTSALNKNTVGNFNIAMGAGGLYANTASNNTAIGWSALNLVSSGSDNIAIGFNAGRYTGSGTTPMTSVSNSIYIGSQSRGLNATGSTNEIVIGNNNVVGLGSNSTVIGNSSTTKAAVYGNVLLGTTTDDGFKLNVNGTGRFTGQLTLGSTITNGTNTYTLPSASGTLALTSGTNTTDTLPKFTGTATLGNSNISDNGTVVAIATDATINGLSLGRGPGNFDSNTVFGLNALATISSGTLNTAVGHQALRNTTTGSSNTAFGRDALFNNSGGSNNVAIGKSALVNNTTGGNNTMIGQDSGLSNTSGSNNVAIGLSSSKDNSLGSYNTAVGRNSMASNLASYNTAVGFSALWANTSGIENVSLGYIAGTDAIMGGMTSTSNSVYIGARSKGLNTTGSTNEIVIGSNAVGLGSNSTVIGNSSTTKAAVYGNVLLGTTTDDGFKLNVNGTGRFTGQLTLGSTITNGTNTYTLPSATGTLALASDLHSPVTIVTANGLSLSGQALSLSVANSSASGALSNSDWSTFNDKLGGSGTTNYIPKFTASRALGNSLIYDDGSNVGIGTNSPLAPLHISSTATSHILRLESNSSDGTTLMLKNNSTGGSFWRLYSSGSANGEGAGNLLFNNSVGVPLVIRGNGNVVVGSPLDKGAKLQVNGAYTNTSSNNAVSATTIDFSLSNIAYSSATSNAITLSNIKDGGIYYLALTATTVSDPVAFIANGFTIKYLGNMTRTNTKVHMYRFIAAGGIVFVSVEKEF